MGVSPRRALWPGEAFVDRAHSHRALTYCGGDALDRPGSAVPDGEDAGQAGLLASIRQ